MTAHEWAEAGPFLIYAPAGLVRPDHEHQAMMLAAADPKRHAIQVHGPAGRLVTGLPCSRAEWMTFVAQVKAGRFDVELPEDGKP